MGALSVYAFAGLEQPQVGPQLQAGPQAQAAVATGFWQPQVQAGPMQALQSQAIFFVSFMGAFLRLDVEGTKCTVGMIAAVDLNVAAIRGARSPVRCRTSV